jgi:hypothetical protein
MGLLASLYAAFFGTRSGCQAEEQPSELTAVAPDFAGFVSNRPREGEAVETTAVAAQPEAPPARSSEALGRTGSAPLFGDADANELTAIAPEFSGRVSNRPQPGSGAASIGEKPSDDADDEPQPG